jgi:hypothetical protein
MYVIKIFDNLFKSMSYDIDIRIEDEGRVDPRKLPRVHEFDANGKGIRNRAGQGQRGQGPASSAHSCLRLSLR